MPPRKCIYLAIEMDVFEKYDRYSILFWTADCTLSTSCIGRLFLGLRAEVGPSPNKSTQLD